MGEKTMKHLADAFAGESQANRKYTVFAEQADKEGYPGVAKMFRTIAAAEAIHARSHFQAEGGVKSTAENLQAAMDGEMYEYNSMYPPMIEAAAAEGDEKAKRSFHLANEAEKTHAALYKSTKEGIDGWKGKDEDWYLCPVCGYVHAGSAPDECPICKAKASVFVKNPA